LGCGGYLQKCDTKISPAGELGPGMCLGIPQKIIKFLPILILIILGTIAVFYLGALENPGADLNKNISMATLGLICSAILGTSWVVLLILVKEKNK
jgi:hypothetical protein